LAAVLPDAVQLGIAFYLYSIGETVTAVTLLGLLLPQVYFQNTLLLKDPFQNDVKYTAMSQPFLSLGVLVTAITLGQHQLLID
jgi:chlorophyll synthase